MLYELRVAKKVVYGLRFAKKGPPHASPLTVASRDTSDL